MDEKEFAQKEAIAKLIAMDAFKGAIKDVRADLAEQAISMSNAIDRERAYYTAQALSHLAGVLQRYSNQVKGTKRNG